MSVKWEEWQQELLERERTFERPVIVRANRKAPWKFWDILAALIAIVLIAAGVAKILEGLQ